MSGTTYDLVVSGRLALPDGRLQPGDVGVRDGRIAAVADHGTLTGAERIEASDRLVLPGGVDTHVHTRSEPEEGITAATRAAAAGGVTTIVDMPYDAGGLVASRAVFEDKVAAVEAEAVVDVALWATIRRTGDLDEVEPLVAAGASGFKVSTFETDPVRFPRISDGDLLLLLRRVAACGSLVAFHAENDEIVRRLGRQAADMGRRDARVHADTRPPVAETEAVGRALELGLATGARVHVVHASLERSLTLVGRARADGVDATVETCTHYLLLDEDELERQGARAKINPPLRPRAQVEALWRALADGRLDWVTSDHVGWLRDRKPADVHAAASGAPGVELTLPLLFSEGVVRRDLPVRRLVEVLAERPARRLGLWPQKGAIAVGADADLVVLDPTARRRVDEAALVAVAGWSPYHGRDVVGCVETVTVRGAVVVRDGTVVGAPGVGTFVRPARSGSSSDTTDRTAGPQRCPAR